MKKYIYSFIAIAVFGTSTCMAKATPKPVTNAKPRVEQKAFLPPSTTTVTTTTETIKPNGTRVITTTTTKTVTTTAKAVKTVQPKKTTVCQKKHGHGTCKDWKKQVKVTPKR